jgi:hypothetical protein
MSDDDFFTVGWHDIGHGHRIKFYGWSPDRELNPQYADVPDIEKAGLFDGHFGPDGNPCCGSVTFDLPEVRRALGDREGPFWQVESLDIATLTISPSLLCGCGDHGFIRNGRWIPA